MITTINEFRKFNENNTPESDTFNDLETLAELVYMDSIDTCPTYWDIARDENEPDGLIDQIETMYNTENNTAVINAIRNYLIKYNITYDVLWSNNHTVKAINGQNMTFRDFMYEKIDAGIN